MDEQPLKKTPWYRHEKMAIGKRKRTWAGVLIGLGLFDLIRISDFIIEDTQIEYLSYIMGAIFLVGGLILWYMPTDQGK